MITPDGWLDWAERVPGPVAKTNVGRNGLLGLAFHSAEGWEAYLRDYQTDPQYAGRRASWQFSNLLNGKLLQHYPVYAQAWTSAADYPNNNMPGIESEGVAGTPLNDLQIANVVRLIQEVEALTGRKAQRNPGRVVPPGVLALVEHRECVQWGAPSTACPSDRYPWATIMARLDKTVPEEEDVMASPVWATLKPEERPTTAPFRSYLLFATGSGLVSRFVPNPEEHDALSESGAAGPLLAVSLATLRAYGAHPDPLKPQE